MTDDDLVLNDAIIMLVTAPIWLAYFVWLVVAGGWNDWRDGMRV